MLCLKAHRSKNIPHQHNNQNVNWMKAKKIVLCCVLEVAPKPAPHITPSILFITLLERHEHPPFQKAPLPFKKDKKRKKSYFSMTDENETPPPLPPSRSSRLLSFIPKGVEKTGDPPPKNGMKGIILGRL